MRNIDNLFLITCTPDMHRATCDYWYLVRVGGAQAHTAFTHRAALLQWLELRGLELTAPLPEHGTYSTQDIRGGYDVDMTLDCAAFASLEGVQTRSLSNAEYTLGILTRDESGRVTEHYLNPNCRSRVVFDYRESRALFC